MPFRGAAQTIPAMLKGDIQLRHRQPRLLHEHHRIRPDAGARGHGADPLADAAGGADHGRGRHAGFRRHVLGSFRGAEGDAAGDRGQAVEGDPRDRPGGELKDRFEKTGAKPLGRTPEEVTKIGLEERPMWQEMVKVSGARLD